LTQPHLSAVYRDYIACLNTQDWAILGRFVHGDVRHNGRQLGLSGYRQMLENDFCQIPDLAFNVQLLISDPPYVSARLLFDCAPKGEFLGLRSTANGSRSRRTSSMNFGTTRSWRSGRSSTSRRSKLSFEAGNDAVAPTAVRDVLRGVRLLAPHDVPAVMIPAFAGTTQAAVHGKVIV
jgi:predicted ester cyclase